MASVFEELNALNVNEHTEKKKSGSKKNEQTGQWEDNYLTYLSWTWAWAEVKKRYPDAHYEIVMHDGLPYVFDPNTGYMVFTNVTIDGITHMMWLPVMDGANKAMKAEPYAYSTKSGDKRCDAATMFDINKTIMRCLVKNLAMFGLGLYIYAGEDIPEDEAEQIKEKEAEDKKLQEEKKAEKERLKAIISAEHLVELRETLAKNEIKEETVLNLYNIKSLEELNNNKAENIMKNLEKIKSKQEGK